MNGSIVTYGPLSPVALTVWTVDLAALRELERMKEQP